MRTPRAASACLVFGLALMTIALAWFTPFGAFPDELDHYERALSIGDGQLVGAPDPEPPVVVRQKTCCTPGSPTALRWVRQGVRMVRVDSDQRPERLGCGHVAVSGRLVCNATPADAPQPNAMGTIEPLGYAPGGLLANAFASPYAYRVTRLTAAAFSLVLIALGVFSLRRRFRSPVMSAAVVLSMSVGTMAVVASGSPNAFEAAGALCFLAGALALTGAAPITGADWWCLGAGGFALTTSRSLGPVWVVALLLVAAFAGRWRLAVDRVRENRRAAAAVAIAIGLGTFSTVAWEALVQPHVAFDLHFFVEQIRPTFGDARFVSRQLFASVGSLPPEAFAWVWVGLAVALVASGAVVADRRARLGVAAAAALLVGAFVAISAAVLRQNGFGIQARHVLPVVIALLVAGAVSWRDRRVPIAVAFAGALVTAGLLAVAWGYLRTSYAPTPTGLAPVAPTLRHAVRALASWPSAVFLAGAALAAASIPLSSLDPAPVERRGALLDA